MTFKAWAFEHLPQVRNWDIIGLREEGQLWDKEIFFFFLVNVQLTVTITTETYFTKSET
jgi:hypothetical protein